MRSPSSTTWPAVMSNSRRIARADRRLAAARFADQRQGLALVDVERDAVDRIDDGRAAPPKKPAADREVLLEVVDLEQRRVAHAATRLRCGA